MVDKSKDPSSVLVDLRGKFRDAARAGVLSGDQKAVFELTLVQIINEAEKERQKCLRLKSDFEIKAAQAEAQASSFNAMQNIIHSTFGNVIDKVKSIDDPEEKEVQEELSTKEEGVLKEIAQRQESNKNVRASKAKAKIQRKTTKKTASK